MDALKFFWRATPVLALVLVAPVMKAQKTDAVATPAACSKTHEPDTRPEQTFYLSNATQQNDANEVTTALRNLLDPNVKIYLVPSQNAILIRATPDQLAEAQKLIKDLDRPRAEVLLDVQVLQVSREAMRQAGNTPASLLKDKDTRVLQTQHLRAMDGQRATLKLGSKIPVATGAAVEAGTAQQLQYLDVGMNIDMTPFVQEHAIALKLKIEDSAQSGTATISGVTEPVISQGVVEQVVQVHDGESSALASSSKDTGAEEIVFLLTPHVVR